jgi:hypothetical protein
MSGRPAIDGESSRTGRGALHGTCGHRATDGGPGPPPRTRSLLGSELRAGRRAPVQARRTGRRHRHRQTGARRDHPLGKGTAKRVRRGAGCELRSVSCYRRMSGA